MLPLAFIILIIIAAIVMYQSREKYTETSYYYEAAPGARGARMVCMPENRGMASLGIAVTKAARYAAKCSGVAKVNHSTINMVGRKAVKGSKPRVLRRSTQAVIRPVKKAPRKIRALTASACKPCTTCKPKKFTKTALKTRKLSAALQAAVRDPARPKKITRVGKKLGSKKVAKKPKKSKKIVKAKKAKKAKKTKKTKKTKMGSAVPGRPGMVYGKNGKVVKKTSFAARARGRRAEGGGANVGRQGNLGDGMVYGKRGNAVKGTDFARRQAGVGETAAQKEARLAKNAAFLTSVATNINAQKATTGITA